MAKIVNKTKVITGPRTRWSYANALPICLKESPRSNPLRMAERSSSDKCLAIVKTSCRLDFRNMANNKDTTKTGVWIVPRHPAQNQAERQARTELGDCVRWWFKTLGRCPKPHKGPVP